MRILMVNTSELTGGAAIAANRLMTALNSTRHEARMLVRDRNTDSNLVSTIPNGAKQKCDFILERLGIFFENGCRKHRLFEVDTATRGTDITRLEAFQQADIIHLHWVNQGMLSLNGIGKILTCGKPIVWTMHDMWPFTGICHHSADCKAWKEQCGNCPILRRGSNKDLSHRRFLKKAQTYAKGKMAFIGCSNWLTDLAKQAPLLQGQRIESIPNAIDTDFYQPSSKAQAREALHLPENKHILLFVAQKATNPNKGIQYLKKALEIICQDDSTAKDKMQLVIVGLEASTLKDAFPISTTTYEYISDAEKMRQLYNASTLLMMPTLQDNLPNTIVEAMACGVPCVGFNVGGLPQLIAHQQTGYLAQYKDSKDFAEGIKYCLKEGNIEKMAISSREKAVANFSQPVVAQQHIALYESLL